MRLRPSSPWLRALLLAFVALPGTARAQGGATNDGALFLLLPVSARSVSMGQAVSASDLGGESVWWNPAGLASTSRVELLLHHSQSLIGTGDAFSVVVPARLLGVFALSASTVNFGEQELGGGPGGGTGLLVPRSFVFAATYATVLTSWLRAGLSYKLVQMRADCSGACQDFDSFSSSTSALDFGMQWAPADSSPLAVGVAIRNVGPKLQVIDTEQADALPTRLHLGLNYRVRGLERAVMDTRWHITAEVLDRLRISRPLFRAGTELRYQERFFLRGGYIFEEGGGPSLGGGLIAGRVSIDIARILTGLSADLGEPPTYISLRYRF